MSFFVSGVLKDLHDARDHIASTVYRTLGVVQGGYPETLDLRPNLPAIRSQGSRGTCAAFASSCLKEWQEKTDSGYTGYMSPEFIYFYRSNKPNDGMYSRDVMSILLNNGCCSEGELPYDSSNAAGPTEIPTTVVESAKNYRIKEYARVLTIEDLKTSLYQNGPCYIAFPVYNYSSEFWKQGSGDNYIGGHAVAVVGYDANGFIIRNSWGTNFGDKGYCNYKYEDFGVHWDIWTVIDIRGSPKPPPQPEDKKCQCCVIV